MLKQLGLLVVRLIGLEPTRRETPDPKSGASTNFATSANFGCKFSNKVLKTKENAGYFLYLRGNVVFLRLEIAVASPFFMLCFFLCFPYYVISFSPCTSFTFALWRQCSLSIG